LAQPTMRDMAGVRPGSDMMTAPQPDLAASAATLGFPCTTQSQCNVPEVCAIVQAPEGICAAPCSLDANCASFSNFGIPSICMTSAAPAGCSIPCDPTQAGMCKGGYSCNADLTSGTASCQPISNSGTRVIDQSCNATFPCEPGLICNGGF